MHRSWLWRHNPSVCARLSTVSFLFRMLSRTTSDPRSSQLHFLMVSDYQLSYQLIPSAHVTDGSCQDLTAVPSALPIALSPLEKTTISLCTYGSSTLLARNEWTTTTQRRVREPYALPYGTTRDASEETVGRHPTPLRPPLLLRYQVAYYHSPAYVRAGGLGPISPVQHDVRVETRSLSTC